MRLDYNRKRLADVARALSANRAAAERERWPRERLERFQQQRLDALADHARECSPFWRERLPRAGSVRLPQLPALGKAEMMDRYDDLVTDRRLRRDDLLEHLGGIERDELWLGEYRAMTTSGSSGRKGLFVYDRPAWWQLMAEFLRYTDWFDSRPRVPRLRIASIAGGGPTHMSQRTAATFAVGLHRILALQPTLPVERLVEALNDFRPQRLNAYPSIAAILAGEQLAGRLRMAPGAISTSSELLTPEVRARVESAFGARVTDLSGSTEGLWGCECHEHAGLHFFEDFCIVENVDDDGRAVPDGAPGARLLVTNLFNRAQPLIRFELTDLVTLDAAPCACGRTLRRARAIDGRADDVIRIGSVVVHPLQFAFVTADPAVREFQVVQRGDGLLLRVALKGERGAAEARLHERLAERLARLGVRDPRVEVEPVEQLERSAGGKLQIVVAEREVRSP